MLSFLPQDGLFFEILQNQQKKLHKGDRVFQVNGVTGGLDMIKVIESATKLELSVYSYVNDIPAHLRFE